MALEEVELRVGQVELQEGQERFEKSVKVCQNG